MGFPQVEVDLFEGFVTQVLKGLPWDFHETLVANRGGLDPSVAQRPRVEGVFAQRQNLGVVIIFHAISLPVTESESIHADQTAGGICPEGLIVRRAQA
jgi:hypothetical protein